MSREVLRTRHGRRCSARRRVDPLRRGDIVSLADARPVPVTPCAEALFLAREHERDACAVLAAAERLPRAQRDAVAARLAGRRPLSPAVRQALRKALASLRGLANVGTDPSGRGSAAA